MRITNEQIIESARRQRQSVHNKMSVEPWQGHQKVNGKWWMVAASIVGFIAGFSLHANMPQPPAQPVAQVVQIKHDTIRQVTTVRDTIYQTRIVTKYEKPMLAESSDTPPEQKACSMLCDDIPYELLAIGK